MLCGHYMSTAISAMQKLILLQTCLIETLLVVNLTSTVDSKSHTRPCHAIMPFSHVTQQSLKGFCMMVS